MNNNIIYIYEVLSLNSKKRINRNEFALMCFRYIYYTIRE